MSFPVGYSAIPGGLFTPSGALAPVKVAPFGMKQTPVTNAEYGALAQSLGKDRFVLLEHNWESGATQLVRQGRTAQEAARGPLYIPEVVDFDRGHVLMFGMQILVKMVDNPSAFFDGANRLFSGAMQPAITVTYFHAKAWCLLTSLEADEADRYDLPTDEQYEYVASDRGTKEYGTETGSLYDAAGRRLAHIDEWNNSTGTTVTVDDPRYAQDLPFSVQTTGNVWRWIRWTGNVWRRMQGNPHFKRAGDPFWGPYGMRGGSWFEGPDLACASYRIVHRPHDSFDRVGFQPVIVPQNT